MVTASGIFGYLSTAGNKNPRSARTVGGFAILKIFYLNIGASMAIAVANLSIAAAIT